MTAAPESAGIAVWIGGAHEAWTALGPIARGTSREDEPAAGRGEARSLAGSGQPIFEPAGRRQRA